MAALSLALLLLCPVMMAMLLKKGIVLQPAIRMESGSQMYPSVVVCVKQCGSTLE